MNTKSRATAKSFASVPWQGSASRHTLLQQMAASAEKLAAQGQRIRDLRKFARVSQETVARAIDVTVRAYQRWEAGVGEPGPENLRKLAEYFATTEDFIEYGTMKRETPDVLGSLTDSDVAQRLSAVEQALARIGDQLTRLEQAQNERAAEYQAESADRTLGIVAEVTARIDELQRTVLDVLQQPRRQAG